MAIMFTKNTLFSDFKTKTRYCEKEKLSYNYAIPAWAVFRKRTITNMMLMGIMKIIPKVQRILCTTNWKAVGFLIK
jgi:hypothetical protein